MGMSPPPCCSVRLLARSPSLAAAPATRENITVQGAKGKKHVGLRPFMPQGCDGSHVLEKNFGLAAKGIPQENLQETPAHPPSPVVLTAHPRSSPLTLTPRHSPLLSPLAPAPRRSPHSSLPMLHVHMRPVEEYSDLIYKVQHYLRRARLGARFLPLPPPVKGRCSSSPSDGRRIGDEGAE